MLAAVAAICDNTGRNGDSDAGGMVDRSKLERELGRIGRQVSALRTRLAGAVKARWWTRVRESRLLPVAGGVAPGPKVAVFLVYQPAGCPESLFRTLRHVADAGYAALVVCNGGVPAADRDRLLPLCWQFVERPNIGYDFGGYRDGIWLLGRLGVTPERLLVMNDTIWFPAVAPLGTIARLEALDADYAALCNFVYRPRSGRKDALVRRSYASSFCFLLSGRAVASEAFRRYWAKLPLHAAKPLVVEQGEVGFSRAMEAAGFPPRVLHDHRAIAMTVEAMEADDLAAFLRRLPVLNARIRPGYEAMLAQLDAGRLGTGDLRDYLLSLLPELNPWDSLVYFGLVKGWTDFVKKANLKDAGNARRFLKLADADRLALMPEVRAEIAALALR